MSIRDYYNGVTFEMPNIASTTMNIGGVLHTKNATGYSITDSNTGQKLLAFDTDNNLLSSSNIYNNIFSTVNELNTSSLSLIQTNTNAIQSLETSIQNMQNQGGQPQGLSSVLTIGNSANNLNINNVDTLSARIININGINITTNGSNIVIGNFQAGQISSSQIYLNNTDINVRISSIENYIQNLKAFFTVLSQSCEIKHGNGNNFDFSNLMG